MESPEGPLSLAYNMSVVLPLPPSFFFSRVTLNLPGMQPRVPLVFWRAPLVFWRAIIGPRSTVQKSENLGFWRSQYLQTWDLMSRKRIYIGAHRFSPWFYSPTTAAGQSRRREPSVITRCSIWPTTFRCRGRESFSPSCLWDLTCSLSLHQRRRYQNPLGRGFWWNLEISTFWPIVAIFQGFPGINLQKIVPASLHFLL